MRTFILSKIHGEHGLKETSHRLKDNTQMKAGKHVFAFPLLGLAKGNVFDI